MNSPTASMPNTTLLDRLQHGITATAFFVTVLMPGSWPSLYIDSQQRINTNSASVSVFTGRVDSKGQQKGYNKARPFTRRAYMRLENIKIARQVDMANYVLAQLEAATPTDILQLPSVHFAEIEETSTILLEWIFPTCRLIFNIEQDAEESGWGFVSTSGEMQWGGMESADYAGLVKKLLEGSATNNG